MTEGSGAAVGYPAGSGSAPVRGEDRELSPTLDHPERAAPDHFKPDPVTRYETAGPFYTRRWLYRLGFDWLEEMTLNEGYDMGVSHLPVWAQRPGAGIVGTWTIRRRRFQWRGLRLFPWLRGPAKCRHFYE